MVKLSAFESRVVGCAALGCSAWVVYGVVETVLSIGAQLFHHPEMNMMAWQWRLIVMLMGVYAAAGLILGAMNGAILGWTGRHGRHSRQLAASLSLALAFACNLNAGQRPGVFEYAALCIAVTLGAAFAAGLFVEEWGKRIVFLASPWTTSLLLLGAPWASWEAMGSSHSTLARAGAAALLLASVMISAALVRRLRPSGTPAAARQTVAACAAFGVFFILAILRSAPASIRRLPTVPAPEPGKPNIVLITMDTVRADHLPMYGYEHDTSPHLREFAGSATLYTRATATSNYTLPTHASMFSGLYPPWHGALRVESRDQPQRPGVRSLAEVLASQGYWTVESVANSAFLAPWTGLTRGFLVSETVRPVNLSRGAHRFYLRDGARRFLGARGTAFDQPARVASDITEQAEAMLAQARLNGHPFFLFLNYMDAHWPYAPEESLNGMSRGGQAGQDLINLVNERSGTLSAQQRDLLLEEYDEGIAGIDASLGRVIERLRSLGLYDNTLIAVTSDHGEGFLEHGFLEHRAGVVYQENLHVPLLIKYPRQREAMRSDALASQVDLMPTILEATSIAPPAGVQGRSLSHAQAGDSRAVFADARSRRVKKDPRTEGTRRAVLFGSLKLIAWSAGPWEMYDLSSDPAEKHNLYSAEDPRAVELSHRLTEWEAAAPPLKHGSEHLDDSVIERLKSLGYAQ